MRHPLLLRRQFAIPGRRKLKAFFGWSLIEFHQDGDGSVLTELDGVREQVAEDLLQSRRVTTQAAWHVLGDPRSQQQTLPSKAN